MILSNSLIVKAQSNAMIALAGAAFLVKDTFQDAQLENVAKQIEAVSVQLEILDVDGKFLTACGGTIVDSDKILTTSHCFFNVGKQKPFGSVRVSFTSDIVSELKNDKENLERYRQIIAKNVAFAPELLKEIWTPYKEEFFSRISKIEFQELRGKKIDFINKDFCLIQLPASPPLGFTSANLSTSSSLTGMELLVLTGSGATYENSTIDYKNRFFLLQPYAEYSLTNNKSGTISINSTSNKAFVLAIAALECSFLKIVNFFSPELILLRRIAERNQRLFRLRACFPI